MGWGALRKKRQEKLRGKTVVVGDSGLHRNPSAHMRNVHETQRQDPQVYRIWEVAIIHMVIVCRLLTSHLTARLAKLPKQTAFCLFTEARQQVKLSKDKCFVPLHLECTLFRRQHALANVSHAWNSLAVDFWNKITPQEEHIPQLLL